MVDQVKSVRRVSFEKPNDFNDDKPIKLSRLVNRRPTAFTRRPSTFEGRFRSNQENRWPTWPCYFSNDARSIGYCARYLMIGFICCYYFSCLIPSTRSQETCNIHFFIPELISLRLIPFWIVQYSIGVFQGIILKEKITKMVYSLTQILIFLLSFGSTQFFLFLFKNDPLCQFLLKLEQIRFALKFFSMIIETKFYEEEPPHWQDTVYFLTAPTLEYMKEYKRLPEIRWAQVKSSLWNLHFGLSFMIIYKQFWFNSSIDRLLSSRDWLKFPFVDLTTVYISAVLIWACFLFWFHFGLQTFMREILRFPEIHFFKDIWNSQSIVSLISGQNLIISNFIKRYFFYPITKVISRKMAHLVVNIFILIVCDLFYTWVYQQVHILWSAALAPLLMIPVFFGNSVRALRPKLIIMFAIVLIAFLTVDSLKINLVTRNLVWNILHL